MAVEFNTRSSTVLRLAGRIAVVVVLASSGGCQIWHDTFGGGGGRSAPSAAASSGDSAKATDTPGATSTPVSPAAAQATGTGATPPAPPAPEPVDFDLAIERATTALFTSAGKVPDIAQNPPRAVMIDPLVDGNNAQQTNASESMGQKIAGIISSRYQQFEVAPFRQATLDRDPLVLIGTLTAINAAGDPKLRNDVYRICLALVDVRGGKVLAKGVGRATEQSVDATPTAYFIDSPTWVKDKYTEGYIKTCQGTRAGDAADALYVETLPTAMLIDEALRAYNDRNYADAQRLYRTALAMPAGEQKRVINGLYLSSWRLNQPREAEDAFGKIVTRGLFERRLGLRFLFKPASTEFVDDRDLRAQYALWERVLAQRIDDTRDCVAVVGHASKTGDPEFNEILSLRRAQAVSRDLARENPALRRTLSSQGMGSRETIVGSGTDDLRDALDRRVEFKVEDCRDSRT